MLPCLAQSSAAPTRRASLPIHRLALVSSPRRVAVALTLPPPAQPCSIAHSADPEPESRLPSVSPTSKHHSSEWSSGNSSSPPYVSKSRSATVPLPSLPCCACPAFVSRVIEE